jgi:hypothetical protein
VQWIYAGTDWTWFDHVRLGDAFRVEAKMTAQSVKSGRRFGRWALQSGEVRYLVGERLVAAAVGHCARTPRSARGEPGAAQPDPTPERYSPEALAAIEAEILAEPRRGAEPRYWEDVAIGEAVPPVVKGPLTSTDIIAWYAAFSGAQHYGGAHGNAVRYRRRHADYHLNPRTGARDSAGRGHLESDTGRDVGMGGAYDIGPQRISWGQHMLTNWIGDHGFLHRLNVSIRAPNLLGSTTWWRGEITAKHRGAGGACLVDLDVRAENQRGEVTALGTATVALASRAHGPVPLPLAPEEPVE